MINMVYIHHNLRHTHRAADNHKDYMLAGTHKPSVVEQYLHNRRVKEIAFASLLADCTLAEVNTFEEPYSNRLASFEVGDMTLHLYFLQTEKQRLV